MELKRTIVDLFPDKSQLGLLTLGIEDAIRVSFNTQSMRNPTHQAVKERFDRCIKWAEILRGDLGWGTARIVNALPDMLSAELSGQAWNPSKRQFWLPQDGV